MKKLGLILIALMIAATVFTVGCGGDEEASPVATATPEITATPVVTPAPTEPPSQVPQEIVDLLGKTAAIESMKYTMVMNAPGLPPDLTSEVWQKPGKMKYQTTAFGAVTYTDYIAQQMCTCIAEMGCDTMDFTQAPPDPILQSEAIIGFQPTVIGSETVDGKDCLVFEYTTQGVQQKWWVDKENGWPVRIEMITPQGTTSLEYTDVEFVDIPDSEFEFPAECAN
jgi:outer membrane lipoprotein-sorting protein